MKGKLGESLQLQHLLENVEIRKLYKTIAVYNNNVIIGLLNVK